MSAKNKKKKNSKISYIFLIIALLIFIGVGINLFIYIRNIIKAEKTFDTVKELIIIDDSTDDSTNNKKANIDGDRLIPDYSQVYTTNSDYVGWIKVQGTKIDYPVMQTPDDEQYYLHRNFYKKYDYSGVPFCSADADLKRPSENIVIYGHHMRAGTMFSNLDLFKKESFYKSHKTFTFDTIYRSGTYEIIAVCLTDANDGSFPYWMYIDCSEADFNDYLTWMSANALYHTDGINSVQYGDKLVTLSTCAYHVNNGRLIVIGKLIDSDDADIFTEKTIYNEDETDYN